MRSCLECTLFHFAPGQRPFSENTDGWDPELRCDATPSQWELNMFDASEREVRRKLVTAATCPDFIQIADEKGDTK